MSKRTVDKQMIYVDWTGDWRVVNVVAETESSVWMKSRWDGGKPARRNRVSTDGKFYELSEIDQARERLRDKAEVARKKAGDAANRLARLDLYRVELEKREQAQEETFELARMQDKD